MASIALNGLVARSCNLLRWGWGLFVDDAVYGGPGDPMVLCDLAQALSAPAIAKDGFTIEIKRPAADVTTLEAGAPHAGTHPLDNKVAFQFRDRPDDHHDGAAQGAAGVDLLAETDELDLEPVQLVQHFEEVLHRPCDPVRGPDQDHVEASPPCIPHQIVESGPARLRAGRSGRCTPARSRSHAGQPSAADRGAGSPGVDPGWRPACSYPPSHREQPPAIVMHAHNHR
jgi:hypothetical protein